MSDFSGINSEHGVYYVPRIKRIKAVAVDGL